MKKTTNNPRTKHILSRFLDMVFVLPILSVLLCLPVLTGCSSCSNSGEYDFKTSDNALASYQGYLTNVRDMKTINTNDFCKEINHWKEYTDTVYKFLAKDSVFIKDVQKTARFNAIHDSIRHEMLRLTETWRYSYSDVLKVKEQTSSFHEDKELQDAVRQAEPFFLTIDSIPIYDIDKHQLLQKYRDLLHQTKSEGITNTTEMLAFIKSEDVLFRSFLHHLYDMDNEPISDITRDTEVICRSIFVAASEGKIPAKDVMVFMSMRTVRRLVQNSAVCVEDINKQSMKSKAQGNAYLWMIIQPFISIDQFSIATMTPQEKSSINYVMNQLPRSTQFAKTFDIDQRSLSYLLPQQLMKMYVLSL